MPVPQHDVGEFLLLNRYAEANVITRRRQYISVVTLTIACLAVGLTYLGLRTNMAGESWSAVDDGGRPGGRTSLNTFDLLTSAKRAMPEKLEKKVIRILGATADGLWFWKAARAQTVAGAVWVVPGHRRICLVEATGGSVACDSVADVVDRGLALEIFRAPTRQISRPHDFVIYGVVPNWVKFARVQAGKRRPRAIPIKNNVFALRSANNPLVLLRLEAPRRRRHDAGIG